MIAPRKCATWQTFSPLPTSVISSPDPTVSCEEVLQQLRIHSFWNDLLAHPGKQNQQTKLTKELWSRCQKATGSVSAIYFAKWKAWVSNTVGGCLLIVKSAFGKFGFYQFYSRWHIFLATSRTTTLLYNAMWASTVLLFKRRTCAT